MTKQHRLQPLLAPRSLAIVGASPREGRLGYDAAKVLLDGGYEGTWHPVNPTYEEVLDRPCHASLRDLPGPVDMAIACVGGNRLEALFDDAIETGTPAITIFDNCYVEEDTEPRLLQRLRDKAREAGLLVCGGNGMGFYNFASKTHASFQPPMNERAGNVALIAHSGSVFVLLANHDLRYRCNMVISAGQEIGCTAADYLDYALEEPTTKVVALFLETVRDPDGFRAGLEKANMRGIPVVVLKTGRTTESAEVAATHSGAIAGNDAAFEALFDRYGVIRANNLDDLLAISAVLSHPIPLGPGDVGAVTDSGGLCELLIDQAADLGVPFAALSDNTRDAMAARLPEGLRPNNPLDGAGPLTDDFTQVFDDCLAMMLDDPSVGLGVFEFEIQDRYRYMPEFIDIAKVAGERSGKPLVVLNSLGAGFNHDIANELADAGVPLINGVETCLRAVKGAFAYRAFKERPPLSVPPAPHSDLVATWRARLTDGTPLGEHEGLQMLADFGVPVVGSCQAANTEEVLAAANDLGWPVALKTAEDGILHKSDVGGVHLGLGDEQQLMGAYDDVASRLGPKVVIQPMAPSGVELAFGMISDEQFGPVILVSAGGTLIEFAADKVVALAPIDEAEAERLISGLKINKLLDGYRGDQAVDKKALRQALVRFSRLVHALSDVLVSLDVNPMICGPDGCMAADAVVVGRQ